MGDRLDRLRDALLVQCLSGDAVEALELADRPGTGLVVTTSRPEDVWVFAGLADGRPLLVDAARYVGGQRLFAAEEFDRRWLGVQRAAGLAVLTDSGYLADGDEKGLLSVLHRAADLAAAWPGGDVVAMLAMHPRWLHPSGGLDRLLHHVAAVGVPIAVALEHPKDPLGVGATLHGMLALLAVGVPVIGLRGDVSGLGLLAHGAWAAAVGTRTRLRHLYPMARPGGGPPRTPSVATVVRELLAYVTVAKIAAAVQRNPDDSLWQPCSCRACRARQLDWIARAPDEATQQRAAFAHALETLFDLRDDLLGRPHRGDRQVSWQQHCSNALARYDQLLREDRQPWERPPALRHWYTLPVPTPAASP